MKKISYKFLAFIFSMLTILLPISVQSTYSKGAYESEVELNSSYKVKKESDTNVTEEIKYFSEKKKKNRSIAWSSFVQITKMGLGAGLVHLAISLPEKAINHSDFFFETAVTAITSFAITTVGFILGTGLICNGLINLTEIFVS